MQVYSDTQTPGEKTILNESDRTYGAKHAEHEGARKELEAIPYINRANY